MIYRARFKLGPLAGQVWEFPGTPPVWWLAPVRLTLSLFDVADVEPTADEPQVVRYRRARGYWVDEDTRWYEYTVDGGL